MGPSEKGAGAHGFGSVASWALAMNSEQASCGPNHPSPSSVYWDYAMTIRLEEIVYLHCHQQGRDHGGARGWGVPLGSPAWPHLLITCAASNK